MRCARCPLVFCDRACLRKSWGLHRRVCGAPRKWVGVEMAIERTLAAQPRETPPPDTATCYICLEPSGVRRACACRGDAGCAHLQCLVDFAASNRKRNLLQCPLCLQMYEGRVGLELARMWWQRTRDFHDEGGLRRNLRGALLECGEYEAASRMHESDTDTAQDLIYSAQDHCAAGRYHEAIRDADTAVGLSDVSVLGTWCTKATALVYLGQIDHATKVAKTGVEQVANMCGPDSRVALIANFDHARFLRSLGYRQESRAILRTILPVQSRLLGRHHPETRHTAAQLATLD